MQPGLRTVHTSDIFLPELTRRLGLLLPGSEPLKLSTLQRKSLGPLEFLLSLLRLPSDSSKGTDLGRQILLSSRRSDDLSLLLYTPPTPQILAPVPSQTAFSVFRHCTMLKPFAAVLLP